jgi:replicative DNA helicase
MAEEKITQQELRNELFNIEAEQAVLGTIILNNEYLNRVIEFLRLEDFYEPAHQKIYAQIIHNVEKIHIVANQVTLKQFFESETSIKASGGSLYLSTLLSAASAIIDIADYGRVIHDLALKRQLVMIGEGVVNDTYSAQEKNTAHELIEKAETELFALAEHGNVKSDFRNITHPLKETLDKAIIAKQRDSHISGVSTGLTDLDKILGGMQQSDLIILAARPSMGKTSLAVNIAVNACKFLNKGKEEKDKMAVGIFSLEMSADQLASRILATECSINATKFRTGQMNETEWEAVATRSAEISKLPLFIDDTPALTIAAIRTRTRRMIRKHNLGLLVIDYLQLLRGSSRRSNESRVQEVSEITQGLKAIAKEFNIPVLALSQLSRAVESRDDKRPQLSDLRESGSIEQDADVVAFIYRPIYYIQRENQPTDEAGLKRIKDKYGLGEYENRMGKKYNSWEELDRGVGHVAEIMISKQRNGPVGNLYLYFDAEFTRFGNLDVYHG